MKVETIKTEIGQIEYSIVGQGRPVLFIHGGHSNCYETLCTIGFNHHEYQLIIPSRPGYGNTPLGDKTTPKKSAELIISLLDSLNIDKVILYAISAGGPTGIELAANYTGRVEKLVLASAVSKKWLDKNDKEYKAAYRLFTPKMEGFIWSMIRLFSKVTPRLIANSFYPQLSDQKVHRLENHDIRKLCLLFKHFNSKEGFLNDINHATSSIEKIKCPTLVIHSKHDTSVSYSHALHSSKMIKNARLVGLENEWGHLFWIGKDSKDSIEKTLEFIEQ